MDIVDIYLECGSFHEAVRRSGLPPYVAHLKLLKSGCLKIHDKINYGSKSGKLGGLAEREFQRLVPDAIDANKYFQKNNPVYDFVLDDLTIDVKYSSNRPTRKSDYWGIKTGGEQDVIVAFCQREKESPFEDYFIVLLPSSFLESDSLAFTKTSAIYKEFRIEPEELQPLLKEYAGLKKEGLL